jgi:hypothetical protein
MIKRLVCVLALLLVPACGLLVEEDRAVVADVGGERVRLGDLKSRIRALPFEERAKTSHADPSVRAVARRKVLEDIVLDRLMLLEAEASGETVSDEEIEAALERERGSRGVAESTTEGIRGGAQTHEHGGEEHTRREIKEARESILISKLSTKQFSDAAMRKFYEDHIDKFLLKSPLVSYEMLLVTPADADFVDTLYEKAAGTKTPFVDIFNSFDSPPGILFAGMTPTAPLDSLAPALREHVENLKVGEVSRPFRIRQNQVEQYGVARLVRYMDRLPFGMAVKQNLRPRMRDELTERLKKKYEVAYHYDKLDYEVGR